VSFERFLEAGRFLSVGVANTLTGLAVIYAAKWFFRWGDVAANVLGYSTGFLLSFALNSRWTFAYRGPQLSALAKFLLTALVGYAANLLIVLIAIHNFDLNGYVAQATGVVPYMLITYLASKYLVFRDPP
jgi:putative flippase GtrA